MISNIAATNMPDDKIVIRQSRHADWPKIVEGVSKGRHGKNLTVEDLQVEINTPEVLMLVAENSQDGQILGHVAVSKHGTIHAYVSLFFALDDDQLLYDTLWKAAINFAKSSYNIVIDSSSDVLNQLLINHYHFKLVDWKLSTYAGKTSKWQTIWKPAGKGEQLHVCHAQMVRAEDLDEFEHRITNLHRPDWWRDFMTHSNLWIPGSVSLIVTKDSTILGFGTIRPGRRLPQLGPLYSSREDVARLLIRNLFGSSRKAREEGVEVSVPSCNAESVQMIERLGLQLKYSTQRYCTKMSPRVKMNEIYAVSDSVVQFV